MSHSHGEIWTTEGTQVGWFEYNGTVDVACARVYKTSQEMSDNWRGDNWRHCQDPAKHKSSWQPIILYTSYGAGFWWEGKVCWGCMAIVEGLQPTGDPTEDAYATDGHPFFQQQMLATYGRVVPCPKCGGELRTRQDGDEHHCPIYCETCKKGLYGWDLEKQEK